MALGIIGKKIGMTRVFDEEGNSLAVTVVHAPANHVTQVKVMEKDGYLGLQMSAGQRKASRIGKALTGHCNKSGIVAGNVIKEFCIDETELRQLGDTVGVDAFTEGQIVDVAGVTKGKGFAGVIKRHNFSSLDMSHGNSLAHRSVGSTGQCQDPGKVFKGKKMPGQLGNTSVTIKNLKIIAIDTDDDLLFIGGAIPGSRGQYVTVKSHSPLPPAAPSDDTATSGEQTDVAEQSEGEQS